MRGSSKRSGPILAGILVLAVANVLVATPVAAAPGDLEWVSRYRGAYGVVAVSPDGTSVFTTGTSHRNMITIAYEATTGIELWHRRYDGPAHGVDDAYDLVVSPDGGTVYVTGLSWGGDLTQWDSVTVAYAASTGAIRWKRRYDRSSPHSDEFVSGLAIPPGGGTLYATGRVEDSGGQADYFTVAYDAATGEQLWSKRFTGPGTSLDSAAGVAASPDGSAVCVTGESFGSGGSLDYATVAYDPSGTRLWVRRYDGADNSSDSATAIAVSADATKVFVTGESTNYLEGSSYYVTIAYDSSTGMEVWSRVYAGPAGVDEDAASAIAVDPGGRGVFVTGSSAQDYGTLAYTQTAGRELWSARYDHAGGYDWATALAVRHDVFVTGWSRGAASGDDYATIAYDATSGTPLWTRRFDGTASREDRPSGIAASGDGASVYVAGRSRSVESYDITTLRYAAR
jgi:WD40 repeat protein